MLKRLFAFTCDAENCDCVKMVPPPIPHESGFISDTEVKMVNEGWLIVRSSTATNAGQYYCPGHAHTIKGSPPSEKAPRVVITIFQGIVASVEGDPLVNIRLLIHDMDILEQNGSMDYVIDIRDPKETPISQDTQTALDRFFKKE